MFNNRVRRWIASSSRLVLAMSAAMVVLCSAPGCSQTRVAAGCELVATDSLQKQARLDTVLASLPEAVRNQARKLLASADKIYTAQDLGLAERTFKTSDCHDRSHESKTGRAVFHNGIGKQIRLEGNVTAVVVITEARFATDKNYGLSRAVVFGVYCDGPISGNANQAAEVQEFNLGGEALVMLDGMGGDYVNWNVSFWPPKLYKESQEQLQGRPNFNTIGGSDGTITTIALFDTRKKTYEIYCGSESNAFTRPRARANYADLQTLGNLLSEGKLHTPTTDCRSADSCEVKILFGGVSRSYGTAFDSQNITVTFH